MATYLHVLDGRLRVRLPRLKGARRAAAALRKQLRALDGVTSVDISLLTGSVLVTFDAERITADEILSLMDVSASPSETADRAISSAPTTPRGIDVQEVIAKKAIELAAERLLLALLF